ncbi:MAG: carboxypeptidase-like regulatory domain-containing protein [Terracidiphilus sp.]
MRGPIRITRVEGYVANSHGQPLVNAEVTLVQNDKVVYSTRTDADGAFHFDRVSGHYLFRVERTAYAPAAQEVVVTDEIVTHLERKKLYVIVGPGACMDACSTVYTSEREFDKALRRLSRGTGK